jgi:hypothetical protein
LPYFIENPHPSEQVPDGLPAEFDAVPLQLLGDSLHAVADPNLRAHRVAGRLLGEDLLQGGHYARVLNLGQRPPCRPRVRGEGDLRGLRGQLAAGESDRNRREAADQGHEADSTPTDSERLDGGAYPPLLTVQRRHQQVHVLVVPPIRVIFPCKAPRALAGMDAIVRRHVIPPAQGSSIASHAQ